MRELRAPDGRSWQVWAVKPAGFLRPTAGAAGAAAGTTVMAATAMTVRRTTGGAVIERRRRERRVTPVEMLADPPVLQRRRGRDRRTGLGSTAESRRPDTSARRSPADLLPAPWRGGWLVFACVAGTSPSATPERRETRRLAPIPACWDRCSEADLVEHLQQASSAPTSERVHASGIRN
jgi:hypothetical protein